MKEHLQSSGLGVGVGTGGPAAQSPGGEGIPQIWPLGPFATATLAGADAHLCRGDLESGEKAAGERGCWGDSEVWEGLSHADTWREPLEGQGQVVRGAPERWD